MTVVSHNSNRKPAELSLVPQLTVAGIYSCMHAWDTINCSTVAISTDSWMHIPYVSQTQILSAIQIRDGLLAILLSLIIVDEKQVCA